MAAARAGNEKVMKSRLRELVTRPADYESAALPTELGWLTLFNIATCRESGNYSWSADQKP